jgi:hypothetical protein
MKDKKSYIFSKEFQTLRLKFADFNQTAVNAAECDIAGFQGGFFKTTDAGRRAAANPPESSSILVIDKTQLGQKTSSTKNTAFFILPSTTRILRSPAR